MQNDNKEILAQEIKNKVKELNQLIKQANENGLLISGNITNTLEGYNIGFTVEVFEKITY